MRRQHNVTVKTICFPTAMPNQVHFLLYDAMSDRLGLFNSLQTNSPLHDGGLCLMRRDLTLTSAWLILIISTNKYSSYAFLTVFFIRIFAKPNIKGVASIAIKTFCFAKNRGITRRQ
ncbi:hypothetical protein TSMEX_001423 [Taenia solium]|eukprot:TsM_000226800 transcript=TsM_000226800 gene=TsM_000226800